MSTFQIDHLLLLQVQHGDHGPLHLGQRSLFTLHWEHPTEGSHQPRPLLGSLAAYLEASGGTGGAGQPVKLGGNTTVVKVLTRQEHFGIIPTSSSNIQDDVLVPSGGGVARAESSNQLPLCPMIPPGLNGPIKVLDCSHSSDSSSLLFGHPFSHSSSFQP